MDQAKLQAWWEHRQGLDGTLEGEGAAAILEKTGWARSVGGSGPYLGLFARGSLSRDAVDADLAAMEMLELPSARGCTYVLPASDFALGLKAGQDFNTDLKTAAKIGVGEAEIMRLCAAVAAALAAGPMTPDELKKSVGGAARSLGPEGVKKGMSSTLPVALGKLQMEGRIRRIPLNGRLDQQRYRYALWDPSPLEKFGLSREQAFTELARRYFRWIGPATVAEFQWFSGLGVKAAKAAIEPLGLVPLEEGSERLMFGEDQEDWVRFVRPARARYSLVSNLDGMLLLRRDLTLLLDKERPKLVGNLSDAPSHAILERGRLVGLWEFDVSTGSVVWASFEEPDGALREAVKRTERYICEQLGDARAFSLDSPASRAPRIQALIAAGRGKVSE